MVIVMLIAFLGNALVLWAVKRNPRLRTTPNYYITALALTDVLMSFLVMPLSLRWYDTKKNAIFVENESIFFSFDFTSKGFCLIVPNVFLRIICNKIVIKCNF